MAITDLSATFEFIISKTLQSRDFQSISPGLLITVLDHNLVRKPMGVISFQPEAIRMIQSSSSEVLKMPLSELGACSLLKRALQWCISLIHWCSPLDFCCRLLSWYVVTLAPALRLHILYGSCGFMSWEYISPTLGWKHTWASFAALIMYSNKILSQNWQWVIR